MGAKRATYIIVDGLHGGGVKKVKGIVEEDREGNEMDGNFYKYEVKLYSLGVGKVKLLMEGGFKFEDFYWLLDTLCLNLDGAQVCGYSSTEELDGVDADYAMFQFRYVNKFWMCVVCDEWGGNYCETRNLKKKHIYNYDRAEGLCHYVYPPDYEGTFLNGYVMSGTSNLKKRYSGLFTLLKVSALFLLGYLWIDFIPKPDLSMKEYYTVFASSVLSGTVFAIFYNRMRPEKTFRQIKTAWGVCSIAVHFCTMAVLGLIQKFLG